jgi:hypothetical protein
MRRRTSLERLNGSFVHRIRQLEVVANSVAGKSGHDIDRAVAFVAIESLSAWSGFVREFYLSCAFLHPKTIGGQHVSHRNMAITDEYLALHHSVLIMKGRSISAPRIAPRDEPAWHEKTVLARLSASLSLSNNQVVISGLSYQTTFFDQLPTLRNFYAHRSEATAAKVLRIAQRNYGAIAVRHPNELVNVLFAGRVQTLIQEWLSDMKQVSSAICL